VDNVVVTPSKYVYGTPITDWVEYTPPTSNVTLGNGTLTGKWRQLGDTIQCQTKMRFGTTTSLGTHPVFRIPPQFSVDTSKVESQSVGWGLAVDISNQQRYVLSGFRDGNGILPQADNVNSHINATTPFTWADQDWLDLNFSLPIQGWSSSVRMSDGYEGRDVLVGLTGGSVSVPHNTSQKITGISIDSKSKDTTASWDAANSRYIVPVSGFYRITGHGDFAANASAGSAVNAIHLIRNGAFYCDVARRDSMPPENQSISCLVTGQTNPLYLVAGDILEFNAFQTSGVTRQFNGSHFSIQRISSPQTIAMGETVAGYAKNASGQVIPNGTVTTLTGWTTVTDTHAIFNPSTGVLTVNRSGFIDLSAIVSFSPNSTGERAILFLLNNTTEIGVVDIRAASGGITTGVSTSISCYPVKSGDTFIVRAYQSSGGNLSIFNDRTLLSWRIY
jgi:hypothetical protein